MIKIEKQYRQGDVLIHPVEKLPTDAILIENVNSIVLAEGEATGHAHRILAPSTKVRSYIAGSELYLEVDHKVTVDHEEHSAVVLEPGIYHVRRQIEVWMDEVRQVAD